MKGVYTMKRKHGTAVCISYTAPGEGRVRELVETVKRGVNFASELRTAKRRAELALHKRRGEIAEGRYQLAARQTMTLSDFVEKHYAEELRDRRGGGLRTAEKELQRLTTGPVGRELGAVKLTDLNEWRISSTSAGDDWPAWAREPSTATSPGSRICGTARASGSWSRAITRSARSGGSRSPSTESDFWSQRRKSGCWPSFILTSADWPRSRSILASAWVPF